MQKPVYIEMGKWKLITGTSLQKKILQKKIEDKRKTTETKQAQESEASKGKSVASHFKNYKFDNDVAKKDKTNDNECKPREFEDASGLS